MSDRFSEPPVSTALHASSKPGKNQLLAALPASDLFRWQPHIEPVELRAGQVLCDSGCAPRCVVFPTTATVSLLCLTRDGGTAEIATVGHEGVIGISLFMGGHATTSQAVVQSAGQGLRLHPQVARDEAQRAGSALQLVLRYAQALIAQVAQTALCNRYHTIEQQLCRRMLLGLDRSATGELRMTQEAAANLLGVRREGVTAAALKLQQAGVIRYGRGRIEVLDREALEGRTCECYAVTTKEHQRLLPTPAPLPVAA